MLQEQASGCKGGADRLPPLLYNLAQGDTNMPVTAPEWLTRRGGALKQASDGRTWYVLLNGTPQYTVAERPVAGKLGSIIKYANSGKPIESSSVAATHDEAVAAGLEDLRKALGW
jgi:hypothetical protein